MEFTSANPSVVRSVKQRDLLNAWLRALGNGRALPALADYRPDRIADELADMMGYDVEVSATSSSRARFSMIASRTPRVAAMSVFRTPRTAMLFTSSASGTRGSRRRRPFGVSRI